MTTVSGSINATTTDYELTASSSGSVKQSTMDFYNLLTTQLTNQNPLEPVSETDFLGQMAQFSTVEQLEALNASATESQTEQTWLSAQNLLGRLVNWTTTGGLAKSGEVERIDRNEEGEITLEVNGTQVGLDQITTVLSGSVTTAVIDNIR